MLTFMTYHLKNIAYFFPMLFCYYSIKGKYKKTRTIVRLFLYISQKKIN